jgi:hypothetical protein
MKNVAAKGSKGREEGVDTGKRTGKSLKCVNSGVTGLVLVSKSREWGCNVIP